MCTCYPIINRVSELKVHIELTRFVQPEKIEIDANERAVNEKSQYCFFVCTTFDSFLNDLIKPLYLFPGILSPTIIRSEPVEILLCGNLSPSFILIVLALHKHIIHHPDSQQIQIPDGNSQLHTPEKKQGSCHFTVCCMKFFLASTSVLMFIPHSSISFGRTW